MAFNLNTYVRVIDNTGGSKKVVSVNKEKTVITIRKDKSICATFNFPKIFIKSSQVPC